MHNKGFGVSMDGYDLGHRVPPSHQQATPTGGETKPRRGGGAATGRETGTAKKCFVFLPDGTVYCIGFSYPGDPECYCRVYPQKAALGELLTGRQCVYCEDGTPIGRLKTETGEDVIIIPQDVMEQMPVIDPLPPEVVEAGAGTIIIDPDTGEAVIMPSGEPTNGNGKGKGGIDIMGKKIPYWALGVAAFLLLRK